jgi:hypothetical protein
MLVQRTSRPRVHQIAGQYSARQRNFPKAVIERGQVGPIQNRSFAAPTSDVSVADEADMIRLRHHSALG